MPSDVVPTELVARFRARIRYAKPDGDGNIWLCLDVIGNRIERSIVENELLKEVGKVSLFTISKFKEARSQQPAQNPAQKV